MLSSSDSDRSRKRKRRRGLSYLRNSADDGIASTSDDISTEDVHSADNGFRNASSNDDSSNDDAFVPSNTRPDSPYSPPYSPVELSYHPPTPQQLPFWFTSSPPKSPSNVTPDDDFREEPSVITPSVTPVRITCGTVKFLLNRSPWDLNELDLISYVPYGSSGFHLIDVMFWVFRACSRTSPITGVSVADRENISNERVIVKVKIRFNTRVDKDEMYSHMLSLPSQSNVKLVHTYKQNRYCKESEIFVRMSKNKSNLTTVKLRRFDT